MKTTRKRYSAEFKAKVAMEAIRGDLTLAELAAKHGVHHTMIGAWKRQAMDGMASLFDGGDQAAKASSEPRSRNCTPRSASCWWSGIFGTSLRSMSMDRRRRMVEQDNRTCRLRRNAGCSLTCPRQSLDHNESQRLNTTALRLHKRVGRDGSVLLERPTRLCRRPISQR
jgi:transposase